MYYFEAWPVQCNYPNPLIILYHYPSKLSSLIAIVIKSQSIPAKFLGYYLLRRSSSIVSFVLAFLCFNAACVVVGLEATVRLFAGRVFNCPGNSKSGRSESPAVCPASFLSIVSVPEAFNALGSSLKVGSSCILGHHFLHEIPKGGYGGSLCE